MISLSFDEIAAILGGTLHPRAGADGSTVVSGQPETDSREIGPGGIFFAKPGEVTDGHLFVGTALANGATLAVVERLVDGEISQIVVTDVVAALADLARAVVARVRAHGDLKIVGVTGSNGKTTTKNLLLRILAEEGETVAPIASFNNEVGAPLTMLRVTDDTKFLVSEFGASGPGEIERLAGLVTPDVGIVLMVGMAHAGGFGGIERTVYEKSRLVTSLRDGGTAILNIDDARVAGMAALQDGRGDVVWFGHDADADVRVSDVRVSADGTDSVVHVDGRDLPMHLRVLGAHHVMNALAAITAARALGVDPAVSISRIETVELAERWRMQVMGNDSVRIINDAYNASPDSMAAALRTIAQITEPGQRKVAVLGAMSELGEFAGEEHDAVGLQAVRLRFERIVVVGREARRLYLSAIAEGSWDGEAVFFETADEAFDYLKTELRDGDRVLVKSSNSAGLRFLGDRVGELFS